MIGFSSGPICRFLGQFESDLNQRKYINFCIRHRRATHEFALDRLKQNAGAMKCVTGRA